MASAYAQSEKTAASGEAVARTSTSFPDSLEVQKFTPPAPLVRKELPQIQIESSVTVRTDSFRNITIQRGEASTAADLSLPAKPASVPGPWELTPAELERIKWQRRHAINLGATVYNHRISRVQWTDQETGKSYQAWCGFDISLLAGLGRFTHKGESYQFSLSCSTIIAGKFNNVGNAEFKIPDLTDGQIIFTWSDAADSAALTPIRIIQEVISSEKERLLIYQSAREKYQQESAEWNKAHPPVPHDETFILRPHRGSRYLANQPSEQKGQAR